MACRYVALLGHLCVLAWLEWLAGVAGCISRAMNVCSLTYHELELELTGITHGTPLLLQNKQAALGCP